MELELVNSESPPCGTLAAVSRHRKLGEPLDEACRIIANEYMSAWRKTKKGRNSLVVQRKSRDMALIQLSKKYPDEYRELYLQAKAELTNEMKEVN